MIAEFTREYRWLSNFVGGVEQEYQAAKCVDPNEAEIIRNSTPAKAKHLGRTCKKRDDWENIKVGVMKRCLRVKFAAGGEYAEKLLATGDEELVEGNWWGDRFWGVCGGVGQNNLGKLLMEIRTELRRGT